MNSLKFQDYKNLLHENEVVCDILRALQGPLAYWNQEKIEKYLLLRTQIQSQLVHYIRHHDFHLQKGETP